MHSDSKMTTQQPRLELLESPDLATDDKNLNLSDTDDTNDDDSVDDGLPQMTGILHKWTNYLHGWQERYFVLKEGTLTYFKSETDRSFGCRGAVSLARAIITVSLIPFAYYFLVYLCKCVLVTCCHYSSGDNPSIVYPV